MFVSLKKQDSLPLRYRAIHVINHGAIADVMLPLVKMFLSRKLRQRVFKKKSNRIVFINFSIFLPVPIYSLSFENLLQIVMHSSLESLHESVPQEILPESLGGPLTDEEAFDSKFEQRIVDSEEHYVKMAQ